jgi:hypothetical protein
LGVCASCKAQNSYSTSRDISATQNVPKATQML